MVSSFYSVRFNSVFMLCKPTNWRRKVGDYSKSGEISVMSTSHEQRWPSIKCDSVFVVGGNLLASSPSFATKSLIWPQHSTRAYHISYMLPVTFEHFPKNKKYINLIEFIVAKSLRLTTSRNNHMSPKICRDHTLIPCRDHTRILDSINI